MCGYVCQKQRLLIPVRNLPWPHDGAFKSKYTPCKIASICDSDPRTEERYRRKRCGHEFSIPLK